MAEADKSEERTTRATKKSEWREGDSAKPEGKKRGASSRTAAKVTAKGEKRDDGGADLPKVKAQQSPSLEAASASSTAQAANDTTLVASPAIQAALPVSEANEIPKEADTTDNSLLPATHGKAGQFGGPKDRSVKPDDQLALPTGKHFTYERVRSLNPKGFYCAMRWNLKLAHKSPEESRRWWANKKILVTNSSNGKAVVLRAVDVGPHENSGLDILLSPGAVETLGVEIGHEVEIAFADQKQPLGEVM